MPHPFYGTKEWKEARAICLRRSGYRCALCRAKIFGKHMSIVDHIIPRAKRPDLAYAQSNLRLLCRPCDGMRHAEKGRAGRPLPSADASGSPTDPRHHWNQR